MKFKLKVYDMDRDSVIAQLTALGIHDYTMTHHHETIGKYYRVPYSDIEFLTDESAVLVKMTIVLNADAPFEK